MRTIEQFYENGKPKRIYEVNDTGAKHGKYQEFYDHGTLKRERFYINGIQEGLYKFFYPSGALCVTWFYKNNEAHGEYKYFSENGSLEDIFFFMHGEKYDLSSVMDVSNRTPEDEITLSLLFGNNFFKAENKNDWVNYRNFKCQCSIFL